MLQVSSAMVSNPRFNGFLVGCKVNPIVCFYLSSLWSMYSLSDGNWVSYLVCKFGAFAKDGHVCMYLIVFL